MMKMMNNTEKMNKEIMVIAVDHGYGNIKGTGFVFKSGVTMYDTEPTFQQDLLIYEGKYYQIGAEHKEFVADKMMDEDYYILTLAAVAREMNIRKVTSGKVHLAAGLPLTWVSKQKESFKSYLLKNEKVRFTFRGVEYSVE
ncbi:MAG: plasmid segregation actin-type ATPase ParM, partial [Clostridia bacterium]|nr:plasmid segregation actin-type ATPase ParM [Clostridia bacterium]